MKKKVLAVMMSVCVAASLAGCNIFNVMDGDGMVNENGGQNEDQVQTGSDWDLSLMPNGNGNSDGSDQTNSAKPKAGVINDTNNQILLVINEDGLLDKTVNYSDIYNPDNGGIIGCAGDYIYFTEYLPGNYEEARVSRYNFVTNQTEQIASAAPADYYNYYIREDGNALYHLNIEYDENIGDSVFSCSLYAEENGWNESNPGFDGFFSKAATDYDIVWSDGSYMTPYTADGNILVRQKDGNKYFFVDNQGNKKSDDIYLCESASVYSTDGKVIIYHNYGDDYSRNDIMMYNVSDGTSRTILTDGMAMTFVDGKFYYYTNIDKKVYNSYDVHVYDTSTYEEKTLYTKTRTPYFNYSTPGVDFFTVLGNYAFYHDVNASNNLVWKRIDINNSGSEEELTTVSENSLTNYGKIEVIEDVEYCPECGCVDFTVCDAYFVYDGDEATPEVTEKINSTLKSEAEGFVNNHEGYSLAAECEYMHPAYVCTGQATVTGAWVINNKYLSLQLNDYYYYGGAHGGSYTGTYLFDLATGEQVDPVSLYAGSKEEMARIVAAKVKEDYNKGTSSQYGYFAEDADGAAEEAYNYFMDGYETILLTDEGLCVIFGEYSLGPYASGQFIYTIGYDEIKMNF